MYVSLPHNFKGTHMSRFVEILHTEREISVESFRAMLGTMTERLEATPVTSRCPSLLRHEEGTGLRRREPDELPGQPDWRTAETAAPRCGFG